jgi:hypothetical protein
MLSDQAIDSLLDDLCVELGYCLPPNARTIVRTDAPTTLEAFSEAVLRAEKLDPAKDRQAYREVLKFVESAFRRSDSATSNVRWN